MPISRRSFLFTTGLAAFATPLESLRSRLIAGSPIVDTFGYGILRPTKDATTGLTLLELPEGFRYLTFGWVGDPMENGKPTPHAHDGMAAFAGADATIILVRNHEVSAAPAFGEDPYDSQAGGGTTTLVFDPKTERVVSMRPSLTGTFRNCAGGPTPWSSWLSCEETVIAPGPKNPTTKQHGYIFEVPASGESDAEPLKAMGCFVHEAIAIDPATGIIYETEDRARAGLYRFIPKVPGRLAEGGKLQMLAVDGRPRFDTSRGQREGTSFGVHWVDISEPDRPHVDATIGDANGVITQGLDRGGAIFSRLEGASFGDDRLFVTATDGGDARLGQVWELEVKSDRLRLVFESPGALLLQMPDNVCLSPRGGLAICEDNSGNPAMHGLLRDGRIFRFARNAIKLAGERNGIAGDFTTGEFAGVTFSPDGKWLFFNAQRPGITFAVTGPWADGGL